MRRLLLVAAAVVGLQGCAVYEPYPVATYGSPTYVMPRAAPVYVPPPVVVYRPAPVYRYPHYYDYRWRRY